MNKLSIRFDGASSEYTDSIGMFLRHMYYFRYKSFKCCGLEGTFSKDGTEVAISNATTLGGNAIPYDLFLTLNSLDAKALGNYTDLEVNVETELPLPDVPGIQKLSVTKLSNCIYAVVLNISSQIVTTKALGPLYPNTNVELLKDFKENSLSLKFYYRLGVGKYTEAENEMELSKLGIHALTFPIMCAPLGNLGYESKQDPNGATLTFNFDATTISEAELKDLFIEALADVRVALG